MLPKTMFAAAILAFISLKTSAQISGNESIDSSLRNVRSIKVRGSECIGYLKEDTFFLKRMNGRIILKIEGDFFEWRFEDLDGDGFKDILLVHSGNIPELMDLCLYFPSLHKFKRIKNFSRFPDPVRIKGTPFYYSYHRSGCADQDWDSDLFYLRDFSAVRIGNISGVGCPADEKNPGKIYITKRSASKPVLIKEYPISVIEKYKKNKWGFIEQYWKRNYKLFPGKDTIVGKGHFITEGFAIDAVLSLHEVKESDAYIRRETKGERYLFAMTYGEPDRGKPYYWIAVGEYNGMSFVTHFGFHVNINNGKITYFDTLNGTEIDLKTWRKSISRK